MKHQMLAVVATTHGERSYFSSAFAIGSDFASPVRQAIAKADELTKMGQKSFVSVVNKGAFRSLSSGVQYVEFSTQELADNARADIIYADGQFMLRALADMRELGVI